MIKSGLNRISQKGCSGVLVLDGQTVEHTIVKSTDKLIKPDRFELCTDPPRPQVDVKLDRASENLSVFINLEFDFSFFLSHI